MGVGLKKITEKVKNRLLKKGVVSLHSYNLLHIHSVSSYYASTFFF